MRGVFLYFTEFVKTFEYVYLLLRKQTYGSKILGQKGNSPENLLRFLNIFESIIFIFLKIIEK